MWNRGEWKGLPSSVQAKHKPTDGTKLLTPVEIIWKATIIGKQSSVYYGQYGVLAAL